MIIPYYVKAAAGKCPRRVSPLATLYPWLGQQPGKERPHEPTRRANREDEPEEHSSDEGGLVRERSERTSLRNTPPTKEDS
jgi:hypothetical protein